MTLLSPRLSAAWLACRFFALSFLVLCALPPTAFSAIEIDITEGNLEPLPVAIPSFRSSNPKAERLGEEIRAIVQANLKRSGLFKIINDSIFPKNTAKPSDSHHASPLCRLARRQNRRAHHRRHSRRLAAALERLLSPLGCLCPKTNSRQALQRKRLQQKAARPSHLRRHLSPPHRRKRLFQHPDRLC